MPRSSRDALVFDAYRPKPLAAAFACVDTRFSCSGWPSTLTTTRHSPPPAAETTPEGEKL